MPSDAELTFADHMGRYYARRFAFPPMVGRLLGYLTVCEPREQTIGELAEALLASRSAITGAVRTLETMRVVRRSRAAGERVDRVGIDVDSPQALGLDTTEYSELGDLAREGLDMLGAAPAERRAVLVTMAAFTDLVLDWTVKLEAAWEERRAELVARGELPDTPRRRS